MPLSDSLSTLVRNVSGSTRFFGFLGPRGKQLANLGTYVLPGHPGSVITDPREFTSFKNAVDNGLLTYARGIASGPWGHGTVDIDNYDPSVFHSIFDDFNNPATATTSEVQAWTDLNDGATGTNAFQDVPGGLYNVVTTATLDDYHAMSSVNKIFQLASGKKLWFESRFKVAEAATNASTWWAGLTDTTTTGGMQTGALGPLASFDGFLFYKLQGAMAVNFQLSDAGVKGTQAGIATSVTNTFVRVGAHYDGGTKIFPYVDVGAGWVAGTAQTVAPGTQAVVRAIFGVKAGGANAETLQMDYFKMLQLR
jgi:hypothetical protein